MGDTPKGVSGSVMGVSQPTLGTNSISVPIMKLQTHVPTCLVWTVILRLKFRSRRSHKTPQKGIFQNQK